MNMYMNTNKPLPPGHPVTHPLPSRTAGVPEPEATTDSFGLFIRQQTHDLGANTLSAQASALPFQSTGPRRAEPAQTWPDRHSQRLAVAPVSLAAAALRVATAWPSRELGRMQLGFLLDRMHQRLVHTEPFSGAAMYGTTCLFVHQGLIVGAIDAATETTGDLACSTLPDYAEATLYSAPEELKGVIVPLLATAVGSARQDGVSLDTAILNIDALARKLEASRFSGLISLWREREHAFVVLHDGVPVLDAIPQQWAASVQGRTWCEIAGRMGLSVQVLEQACGPVMLSYRSILKNFDLYARSTSDGFLAGGLRLLAGRAGRGKSRGTDDVRIAPCDPTATGPRRSQLLPDDPACRFLNWALAGLQGFFEERNRASRWKYLSGWLPLVRKAHLHYDLPRPQSRESDEFDLVTTDSQGKVLHLVHFVPDGTVAAFEDFVERVTRAKTARIKTGDVGGAILIAPRFAPEVVEAYRHATRPETVTRRVLGIEERFTGYEGFVRIGPRRGFHLLLVVESAAGFEPVVLD